MYSAGRRCFAMYLSIDKRATVLSKKCGIFSESLRLGRSLWIDINIGTKILKRKWRILLLKITLLLTNLHLSSCFDIPCVKLSFSFNELLLSILIKVMIQDHCKCSLLLLVMISKHCIRIIRTEQVHVVLLFDLASSQALVALFYTRLHCSKHTLYFGVLKWPEKKLSSLQIILKVVIIICICNHIDLKKIDTIIVLMNYIPSYNFIDCLQLCQFPFKVLSLMR